MPEPAQCVSNAILCKNILLEKLSFFFSNGQSLLFQFRREYRFSRCPIKKSFTTLTTSKCERVFDQSISKHVASIKYKKETTENPFLKQNVRIECFNLSAVVLRGPLVLEADLHNGLLFGTVEVRPVRVLQANMDVKMDL